MKMRALVLSMLAVCTAACSQRPRYEIIKMAPPVFSESPATAGTAVAATKPVEAKPDAAKSDELTPEEQQAAWMKLAEPGEPHARLRALVGEYDVHGKIDMDGTVVETAGTASLAMIMGGRFLRQEVHGEFQGMPYEGRWIFGYDNGKRKWFGAGLDTMGTGILVSEGEETKQGKVWTFKGSYTGLGGVVLNLRDVVTVVSDKDLTWESYMGMGVPPGDKPMMVLRYKRK